MAADSELCKLRRPHYILLVVVPVLTLLIFYNTGLLGSTHYTLKSFILEDGNNNGGDGDRKDNDSSSSLPEVGETKVKVKVNDGGGEEKSNDGSRGQVDSPVSSLEGFLRRRPLEGLEDIKAKLDKVSEKILDIQDKQNKLSMKQDDMSGKLDRIPKSLEEKSNTDLTKDKEEERQEASQDDKLDKVKVHHAVLDIKRDWKSWEPYKITDVETAYQHRWVGFPKLHPLVDCRDALDRNRRINKQRVTNDHFPHFPHFNVTRTLPHHVIAYAGSCPEMRDAFGFRRYPSVSQEELDFPLAFSILFYKDLDQAMFLLRAIYRPHNAYCLHVDSKASIEMYQAAQHLSACLPNVIVTKRLEWINYAGYNRLQADVNCMSDLLQLGVHWQYFLNLPSQQFPLKTNLQMVKILKIFKGANDIEGITGGRMLAHRYTNYFEYRRDEEGKIYMKRGNGTKWTSPPHNFNIVKGSAYGTFSRAFVDYIINDLEARDLLKWMEHVWSPDEYYWATLNFDDRVPGGYTGPPDEKPWFSVYARWGGGCGGFVVRGICIFSPIDLPSLINRNEFFANKFYMNPQPTALHCLDQWVYNRTFTVLELPERQTAYFSNLNFVQNHTKT